MIDFVVRICGLVRFALRSLVLTIFLLLASILWAFELGTIYILDYLSIVNATDVSKYVQVDVFRLVWVLANKFLPLAEDISNALLKFLELAFGYEMRHNLYTNLCCKYVDCASFGNSVKGFFYHCFHFVNLYFDAMHFF